MLQRLARKILPLLQFTRFALVFTAIADAACTLLLASRLSEGHEFRWTLAIAVAGMSVGLYGFGMTLNDIIDRRRDALLAAHRPLPSGRLGLTTAHTVCAALLVGGLGCAAVYAWSRQSWLSFYLAAWTAGLIVFYNLAGKYLVAPGLVALGLIRFFHAAVPAPHLPLVWHPLLLLNHVTILSAVCYGLEDKRPTLNRRHIWLTGASLLVIDALVIGVLGYRRTAAQGSLLQGLDIEWGLLLPAAAVVGFVAIAITLRVRHANPRQAGAAIMLYGLLWLIVYDAAFVAAYVGILPALAVLLLLPVAYLSVQMIRAWSQIVAIARRPDYIRAEVE